MLFDSYGVGVTVKQKLCALCAYVVKSLLVFWVSKEGYNGIS